MERKRTANGASLRRLPQAAPACRAQAQAQGQGAAGDVREWVEAPDGWTMGAAPVGAPRRRRYCDLVASTACRYSSPLRTSETCGRFITTSGSLVLPEPHGHRLAGESRARDFALPAPIGAKQIVTFAYYRAAGSSHGSVASQQAIVIPRAASRRTQECPQLRACYAPAQAGVTSYPSLTVLTP
jgi:hypothetical protein